MYNDLKVVLNAVRPLDEVDAERIGLAGSGTGAMLALNLADEDPTVRAVVVRGPEEVFEAAAARLDADENDFGGADGSFDIDPADFGGGDAGFLGDDDFGDFGGGDDFDF